MSLNPSSFNPTPYEPSGHASYTPVQGNYQDLQPFRYWCQKVLPLVYDDSLSYYELLCKVVDYLNKTMEDVGTLHDDVDNLHTAYTLLQNDMNGKYDDMSAWVNTSYQDLVDFCNDTYEELTTYVNTYFDNLDVQEEINNKLDDMSRRGELSLLVAPYVPSAVDTWLASHITNPSNPPLDTSLSSAESAAPAKTVGDVFCGQYSNTKTYRKGDVCLYSGTYYKAKQVVDKETFNASHWTATNSGLCIGDNADNIETNKDIANTKFSVLLGVESYETKSTAETAVETLANSYIAANGATSTSPSLTAFSVKRYTVQAGKKYRLKGTGIKLADSFPIAVFYKEGCYNIWYDIIANGSTTATNFNVSYTATSDGEIRIALYQTGGELKLYEDVLIPEIYRNFSKPYDTGKAYDVNDITNYNGTLYQATEVSDKVSFNSDKWNDITMAEAVQNNTKNIITNKDIDDTKINYLLGNYRYKISDTPETPTDTLSNKYIAYNGIVSSIASADFTVKQYHVTAGEKYHLIGTSVKLADNLPMAVYYLNGYYDLGYTKILDGTTEATTYNEPFVCNKTGDIFIAIHAGDGELKLYKDILIPEIYNNFNEVAGNIKNDLKIDKNGTVYNGYYINASRGISSIGNESFIVTCYPVVKGNKYFIYGKNVALQGSFPLAIFRTTGGTSTNPAGTLIASGSTTPTNYNTQYIAPDNGFIYVAGYTENNVAKLVDEIHVYEINKLINILTSKINEKVIWCLGDSITYLGGSWAFQLGNKVCAKQVYNLGRGGATWADRGGSFIVYDEDCAIWDNPFTGVYEKDVTEYYDGNTGLSSNILPVDTQYTTISNEIRFMDRLITEYNKLPPDLIIIACGVNDSRATTAPYSDSAFNDIFNTALDDMTLAQRSTIGGGLRWCIETLMNKYPNTAIILSTPIQTAYTGVAPYVANTCDWIRAFAHRYALPLIDSYNESGICNIFEQSGSNGRYLYDGLHPNEKGNLVMGEFMAKRIVENYFDKNIEVA